MKTMVVILGHGSKVAEHNAGLQHVAVMVKTMTELPVETAYMDNCEPDLGTAIRTGAAAGFKRFVVMPLFLFKGTHVSQDVPQAVETIKQDLPDIEVVFTRHLGADPAIAQLVWERVQEVI